MLPAFLYISLPFLHDYDVKSSNFKRFFEDGKGKAINSTISVWTRARSPLLISNLNSLLLINWATWDNREMVWKDAESIFQRSFHGRRRCRIVRSLLSNSAGNLPRTRTSLSPSRWKFGRKGRWEGVASLPFSFPWSLTDSVRHQSLAFPTRLRAKFEAPEEETELELGN